MIENISKSFCLHASIGQNIPQKAITKWNHCSLDKFDILTLSFPFLVGKLALSFQKVLNTLRLRKRMGINLPTREMTQFRS